MAEKVGGLYYELDLDQRKFKSGMSSASSDLDKIKNKFQEAEKGSFLLLGAITAVAVGIAAFAIDSIHKFEELETSMAQTQAVIKSTGGAAHVTADQVGELANNFSMLTEFSKESIRSGENILLTFTKIGKNVFPAATEVILDMSQALGQDLKSSAIQLGKALQDPIQGITALRRVGVNFTDAQKDMIEKLVKAGKAEEAQKLILQELQTEFGGSARAAGQTFSGSLEILKHKVNNLQEELGSMLVNALKPLTKGIGDWIDSLGTVDEIIEKVTKALTEHQTEIYIVTGAILVALIPAFVALGAAIWGALAPLLPFIAIGAALGFLVDQLVKAFGGWQPLIAAVQNVLQSIWDVVGPILIPALQELWNTIQKELWPALQELWKVLEPVLVPVLKAIATIIGGVLYFAFLGFVTILKVIINVLTEVAKFLATAIRGVIEWAKEAVHKVTNFVHGVQEGFEKVKVFVAALIDRFNQIKDNIAKALGNVWGAITKPFNDAFEWIKKGISDVAGFLQKLNPFHRESPSLVDWITMGTHKITGLYGDMFDNLSTMSTQNQLGFMGAARGLNTAASSSAGPIASQPITITNNLSGIMARSRGELRDIAADLIEANNETLRSRGLPEIGKK